MKAMILAAGRGERMRPLTDTTPKPLLKVQGRHLIEYHIEALAAAGLRELVINTGRLGRQIRRALGAGERYGVAIEYSEEPASAYETGGGLLHALPRLSDPFIAVNADIWTRYDFARLRRLRLRGLAHIVLVDNPPEHPNGDFALRADGVVRVVGEPRFTFSGIGLYRKALLAGRVAGRFSLTPVLTAAMATDAVTGERYRGVWRDVGTPARLRELNAQ